jgi:hypothetical protein
MTKDRKRKGKDSKRKAGQPPARSAGSREDIERLLKNFERYEWLRQNDPDVRAHEEQQRAYAKAKLARSDLPPGIKAKYELMQKLYVETFHSATPPDIQAVKRLSALAAELLPYLHFRTADVNPRKH